MLQEIKMWFWYGRNSNIRGSCRLRTSSDGKWQDQSSQRMEYTYQSQEDGKFFGICKFLQKIHQELQPCGKTS